MTINEGFSLSRRFRALVSRVIDTKVGVAHSYHYTSLDCSEGCTFGTTSAPDSEIECELFKVAETLIYTKNEYTAFVKGVGIHPDEDSILCIKIRQKDGYEFMSTRKTLCSPGNLEIIWIPFYYSRVPNYSEKLVRRGNELGVIANSFIPPPVEIFFSLQIVSSSLHDNVPYVKVGHPPSALSQTTE